MIRRLRARTGIIMAVGLILGGWTLAAAATQPVTRSEMQSFVYATLAVAALAVISGTAGVMALVLRLVLDADRAHAKESREQILGVIRQLTESIKEATRALAAHNDSGDAHPVAMRLNLTPVHEKLSEHEAKLGRLDLKLDYTVQRDPADSPQHRRVDDPEDFDGAKLRGRQ